MKKIIILLGILIVPSVAYLVLTTGKHNIKKLGYFGPKSPGETPGDTVYHSIPEFEFTDQSGNPFGSNDLKDKIYVANFFFTSCPTICPKMQTLMKKVHDTDDFERLNDFRMVSFTVDPDNDTPEVLAEFAARVKANPDRWHFLTGNRDSIYKLAYEGYMANTMEDSAAPGGFLHSDLMFLIDRNNHIRGIYEGTSLTDVKRLIDEIKVLIAEYNSARKENTNPVR
ncbi:MAG: SCO family protein [Bacteroidia bacterium]